MSEKLHLVLRKITEVLEEETPIVLQVGHEPKLDKFLREGRDAGHIQLFTDLTDEDAVPDIIVFSGEMIGMDSGLEYIDSTTTVIVEENQSGALKRRNTAPVHSRAGTFNEWVYLDSENPAIIVYSHRKDVIDTVSKPLQAYAAEVDPLSNYDPMGIPPSNFGSPFLSRGGEAFTVSDEHLRDGLGLADPFDVIDDLPGSG